MSNQKMTLSGHSAGIHSASSYSANETDLKRKRDSERQLDKSNSGGQNAETVYRDKSGRKLDIVNQLMKQQTAEEAKKASIESAQYEWGKGAVQKKEIVDKQQELLEISQEPFARTIDNPKLERHKKQIIRDGDPMAEFMAKEARKRAAQEDSIVEVGVEKLIRRPLYTGPGALPNRFEMKPGYRWDAINRGNVFEHKLLTRVNDKQSLREDEYKWSVSDL
jgi:pre-mRNA-splicing factor CWC26